MLRFHFLNVLHGSSIVIEYHPVGAAASFGVVDSNARENDPVPALEKLQSLGAEALSFVALTHPHRDHYSGMHRLLQAFQGKIDQFICFPFGGLFASPNRLKKYANILKQLLLQGDDPEIRSSFVELINILQWGDLHRPLWQESDGTSTDLALLGFDGVSAKTILPPRTAKGSFIEQIESGRLEGFGSSNENSLSLSLLFDYGGCRVLLSGDSTKANWLERRRGYERRGGQTANATVVNLPHHGSAHDCDADVLQGIFAGQNDAAPRFAITSADGHSHPDYQIIRWCSENGIQPFCTNLMPQCGANILKLHTVKNLAPELSRWLGEVTIDSGHRQTCQGDICVEIPGDGAINVSPQHANYCPLRTGNLNLPFAV
ncbi:MAG TPA: hypothetical protein PLR41_03900 [Alphaproteobacteria bacterium]|nr:hypothetical protein [Alphaproteobacteria bacterium]